MNQKRIPEIIITRFYRPGVLPVAQSTESKHWKECKAKIPTREKCPLDLVISDPSIDSWYRWCCTFYAGTSTLVLKIQYPVHNWQLSCYLYGLCHFLAIQDSNVASSCISKCQGHDFRHFQSLQQSYQKNVPIWLARCDFLLVLCSNCKWSYRLSKSSGS